MVYEPYLEELARSVQLMGGYTAQQRAMHPLIRYPLEIARNLKEAVGDSCGIVPRYERCVTPGRESLGPERTD